MQIYHVTSKATEILISGVIEPKNGKVFFCKSRAGAERMLAWWNDIKFKPNEEKEILELNVEGVDCFDDPNTKPFGGCFAIEAVHLTTRLQPNGCAIG